MSESNTEIMTVRLNRKVLDSLKQEASNKEISLSTLANQALKLYTDWCTNAANVGYLPVTKGLVSSLIENLPDKTITEIASNVEKRESKNIALLMRGEFSLNSVMDLIETRARVSGWSFQHLHKNSIHSFRIQHNLNKKWSTYLASRYKATFEELGLKSENEIAEDYIIFKVDVSLLRKK